MSNARFYTPISRCCNRLKLSPWCYSLPTQHTAAGTKWQTSSDAFFFNEKFRISNKISMQYVPCILLNNMPTLVQIMAWHLTGDKPLFELMSTNIADVTRPQGIISGLLQQLGGQPLPMLIFLKFHTVQHLCITDLGLRRIPHKCLWAN